jgi:hypothetical protein
MVLITVTDRIGLGGAVTCGRSDIRNPGDPGWVKLIGRMPPDAVIMRAVAQERPVLSCRRQSAGP